MHLSPTSKVGYLSSNMTSKIGMAINAFYWFVLIHYSAFWATKAM